ncbi:TPA: PIN domain-containing protein [bacterium]|nr:PIN domain-containing protein [bacterium]
MNLRVYLDTSVFSAYHDERAKDRQNTTKQFWSRLNEFDVATSEITKQELAQTYNRHLRANLLGMLDNIVIYPITEEIRDLARCYVSSDVFSQTMFNDALHVAVAVMTRQDMILSWNFRHLVNRRRRAQINQINVMQGLPTIEIIAPPEL